MLTGDLNKRLVSEEIVFERAFHGSIPRASAIMNPPSFALPDHGPDWVWQSWTCSRFASFASPSVA
jgi:hypothetical protein